MSQAGTKLFVSGAALAAVSVIAATAINMPASQPDDVEAAVFFGLATFVAHGLAYRLPRGGFGNITFIPLLSGVAVAPGFAIVLATAVALLCGEYFRRRDTMRIVFNAAQLTLAVGLAVIVYNALGGRPLLAGSGPSIVAFVAAFAVFFLSNAVSFAGVVSVSSSERFGAVLVRAAGGTSVIYDLIGIPIVFGFAYAYVQIGWAWSGALLIPLVGLRQVYKANRELQTVNEELLHVMVAAIEARDPYTSGHSQRVASYSRVVARAAGVGPRTAERVYTAALLHDVGKIHEEFATILRNPGRLSDEEFAVMKTHTTKGATLVSKVTQFEDLVPAVLGHHEAWDGSGYPNRLAGAEIPLWARIIALADTIDAMTTDRPYREALTVESVRDEIVRQSGRQFDPAIAAALVTPARWSEMASTIRAAHKSAPVPHAGTQPIPRHSAGTKTLASI